ncbi:hypothetical protein BASA83_008693, partial [Batrachochytrium salamandrivorans]
MVQSVPRETRYLSIRSSTWSRFKEKFRATFGEVNQEQVSEARLPDIEWNDSALRSQFYHGLSSEIKDALVHFDNPSSVSAAMDMAIRIDNRLFERRQEQRLSHQRLSSSYALATPITSRFMNQQQQQRLFEPRQTATQNRFNSFINLPSARPIKKSSNDMDIDFVRRGPLSSMERKHRMKQGLCLVCGGADHRKVNCPKSRFKFKSYSSRNIYAIQNESTKQQTSRKPIQFPLRKNFCFLDLHFGSAFMPTFFIDCGADDVFMDAELADRLNIPLVKIPVPIKLRLADGDSSSMITHRTLPLQLHIGRDMFETIGSMSQSLPWDYSWVLLAGETQSTSQLGVQDGGFGSNYCLENCCVGSTQIQGLGKPPRTSDISPKPSIPEQEPEPSDRISDFLLIQTSIQVYSKTRFICRTIQSEVYPFLEASPVSETPIPPEIYKEFSSVFSESKAEILPLHRSFDCTINLSSSAEPSYGRIYQLTRRRREDKVMQEWIAENLAKGFIRNSSSPYGAPCFFVKQKNKLRLCMDYRGLNKQTIKDRNPIPLISEMLRTLSTGKIFTTLDLRGAYNLLRIRRARIKDSL